MKKEIVTLDENSPVFIKFEYRIESRFEYYGKNVGFCYALPFIVGKELTDDYVVWLKQKIYVDEFKKDNKIYQKTILEDELHFSFDLDDNCVFVEKIEKPFLTQKVEEDDDFMKTFRKSPSYGFVFLKEIKNGSTDQKMSQGPIQFEVNHFNNKTHIKNYEGRLEYNAYESVTNGVNEIDISDLPKEQITNNLTSLSWFLLHYDHTGEISEEPLTLKIKLEKSTKVKMNYT